MQKITSVYFDMDGVLCDLYGVTNWQYRITHEDATPYEVAASLVAPQELYNLVSELQRNGITCGVLSWGARGSSRDFLKSTRKAKKVWLAKNHGYIEWDSVRVIPYGREKSAYVRSNLEGAILVDDSPINRKNWRGLCAIDGGSSNWMKKVAAEVFSMC